MILKNKIIDSVKDEIKYLSDFVSFGWLDEETLFDELDSLLSFDVKRAFAQDVMRDYVFDDITEEVANEHISEDFDLYYFADLIEVDPHILLAELDSWLSKDDIDELVTTIIGLYSMDDE